MAKRKPTTYLPPVKHSSIIEDHDSDASLIVTFDDCFYPGTVYIAIYDPATRTSEIDGPPPPQTVCRQRVRVNAHELVSVLQRICPHLEIDFKVPEPSKST